MIKPVHLSVLLFLQVVGLCFVVAGAQPVQAADTQSVAADARLGEGASRSGIGREDTEDPFAALVEKAKPDTSRPLAAEVNEVKEKPGFCQDCNVETVTLKFLKADSLKDAVGKMSSGYGSISTDTKSNSLIVCDTNDNLPKILAAIRNADKNPVQIMIEVVILDVKLDNETEIGINWDMLTTKYRDAVFRQNLGFSNRLQSTVEDEDTIGNATAWNTTGTAADFWLLTGDVRNVIHVLQEKNNVEILASPRVMVVSGKDATIEAVEEIPYREQTDTSQGGASALTSTQFKNVGVMLKVGATLTDGNSILLNVEAEQSVSTGTSVVSGVSGTPIVDKRTIQSSLLLEDGQILVIGGLRRKETQTQTNQIPILGDLPIIGLAFRSTDTVQNNSELLIILSPHIYAGEKPSNPEMEKFNEITKRPLLIIPEAIEKKKEEEKQKERQIKEAEKIEKAKKAKEAREAKKAKEAKEAKEAEEAEKAKRAKKEAEKADQTKQSSKQKYPESFEEIKKALATSSKTK
jgi:type II secretory pathway component GspD/PulD (secretin)